MKCSQCGNIASDSARFCNHCGKPLSAPMSLQTGAAGAGALAIEGVPSGAARDPGATRGAATSGGAAPSVLERAKNILLSPRSEWPRIAGESSSIGELYVRYALPLLLAVALLSFVHLSLIGTSTIFGGAVRMPLTLGLTSALVTVITGAIGLGLLSLIINMLAPTFGAQPELRQALKVAVYSATPSCVASVFSLLPGLGTLLGLIAVLYGIYVLYLGLIPVMQTPKERAVGYTATIIIVTIVLSILLGVVLSTLGGLSHLMGINPTGSTASATSRDAGAAAVGSAIGSLVGSDAKGKSDLGAAIANLAKAGAQSDSAPAVAAPASNASSGAQPGAPSSDDMQNAGAAVGGMLSALGGALNGGRRVEPVNYMVLKGLLPDTLPDMQRLSAAGSAKQGLGMKGSSSTGVYTGANGARVEIEIADASAVSGLMNIAEALPQTTSASSDTSYEKDVMIAGYRAHEKYDSSSQHGELSFMLAKRFTVDVTGDHLDMATLESDAGRVDFGKLVSMKDAGAQ
jgi:Yip1 domain/zinc-ribbon domain